MQFYLLSIYDVVRLNTLHQNFSQFMWKHNKMMVIYLYDTFRYLYGQYKRINMHCGQHGKGLLWGGSFPYLDAQGVGVAHFAKIMLEDKGLSLAGKKCVITGSSHVS